MIIPEEISWSHPSPIYKGKCSLLLLDSLQASSLWLACIVVLDQWSRKQSCVAGPPIQIVGGGGVEWSVKPGLWTVDWDLDSILDWCSVQWRLFPTLLSMIEGSCYIYVENQVSLSSLCWFQLCVYRWKRFVQRFWRNFNDLPTTMAFLASWPAPQIMDKTDSEGLFFKKISM